MNADLRERIRFARHDLARDASFDEMQVIVCREVLIYVDEQLRNQFLQLFLESPE